MKKPHGPADQFAKLFADAQKTGARLSASTRVEHPLGDCEVLLGRDPEGWYLEARQNMGWTDFDAARDGLLAAAQAGRVALLVPGADGVSQPVLRVRAEVSGTVKKTWASVSRALAAMDEYLRLNG